MTTFLILIIIAIVFYFLIKHSRTSKTEPEQPARFEYLNDQGDPMPQELLNLDSTTLADRQRAYGRGYKLQKRYDILQRQAEIAGDADILEALRTNTYDGPLPNLEDEFHQRQTSSIPSEDAPVQTLQYFCLKDKGYHVSVWPKNQGVGDCIEFSIAGMSYRGDLSPYFGEHAGTLEPEPTNPYDSNAVKILAEDGHHVGYVPRGIISEIRKNFTLPCHTYFYIGSNSGSLFSCCYIPYERN